MRSYQRGFTLLEVMLAFTLMVVVISTVLIAGKTAGPEQEVNRQAFRFKTAMTQALDQALLTGQELGLVVDDKGYQFVHWVEGQWVPLAGSKILAPYQIPEDLEMSIELELEGFPGQKESLFESDDGLFENAFETEEEKKKLKPQVFIYSHGEFSDFILKFHWLGDDPFTVNAMSEIYRIELLDDEALDDALKS